MPWVLVWKNLTYSDSPLSRMVLLKTSKRYAFASERKLAGNSKTNFRRRKPRNAAGSPNLIYFPEASCFQPNSTQSR